VEACRDLARQHHLRVLGVAAAVDLGLQSRDLGQAAEGEQLEVVPHQRVADRQQLGEHAVGGIGDADEVALALGHLLDAVQTHQQGHGQDALRLLAVFGLQRAADQQVELLIGAAEFEIGLQRHRVVALHQRVKHLVQADGRAGLVTLGEVVALEHARHGVLGGQLDHAAGAQRVAPFAVVANLGALRIEHQAGLAVVGLGVRLDLFARQRRPCDVAARRVADHRSEVADEEYHAMPQILQLAHLVQDHGMAEMNIRGRRVQAQLDPQGRALGLRARQLLQPFGLGQQFVAPAPSHRHGAENFVGDGERLRHRRFH
jgi:hypothetical protein